MTEMTEMLPIRELLLKFACTPGYCNLYETKRVETFLKDFQARLVDFRSAFGEPVGLTVESILDSVEEYKTINKDKK